jgi:large subunit ribosomal protein L9
MAKNRRPLLSRNHGVQLLLTQSIPQLGDQGEIVTVKAGYARNYLLPNGLATVPSPHSLRVLEKHRLKVREMEKQRADEIQKLADALARHSVSIEANATEEGHLYGSVLPQDIASALAKADFPITAEQVRLEGPLKELGLYTVNVHLAGEVNAEVKVWVVPTQVEK